MMHYNIIDYVCILLILFFSIFKEKKHLDNIYKKLLNSIEHRYLQTCLENMDENII